MSIKKLRNQLFAAIAMVLVASIALGSSTYAWFVNNTRVTATNVNVTASTAYSLLISKDADSTKTWGTTVGLDATAVNLIPASTTGTTDSNGVLRFATDTVWTGNYVTGYKEVTGSDSVTTTKQDNSTITSKYFYKDTVYLKSAQAAKIYLDGAATGIGTTDTSGVLTATKAFSDSNLTAAQKAMLNTMRVAFVVKNETSNTVVGTYAYQLVADGSGDTHYSTTENESGANGVTAGVKVSGDALASPSTWVAAPAEYSKDNEKWINETVPVITSMMATGSDAGFATVGSGQALATVAANDVVKVDIYVWMEGCDYDVNATNLVNFQEADISAMMFGFCIGSPTA